MFISVFINTPQGGVCLTLCHNSKVPVLLELLVPSTTHNWNAFFSLLHPCANTACAEFHSPPRCTHPNTPHRLARPSAFLMYTPGVSSGPNPTFSISEEGTGERVQRPQHGSPVATAGLQERQQSRTGSVPAAHRTPFPGTSVTFPLMPLEFCFIT